jgi:hypothetical protein
VLTLRPSSRMWLLSGASSTTSQRDGPEIRDAGCTASVHSATRKT